MTDKERLQQIEQRLELLIIINEKIEKIVMSLEQTAAVKKYAEPLTTFTPANNKSRDDELKAREMEIFQSLDNQKRR